MTKKIYIIPKILFEDVENDNALCDISAGGHNQGWGECAKSATWVDDTFENPFEDTAEKQATSDFVFNNDLNW